MKVYKIYVIGDSDYYRNKITTLTRLSKQIYYANYFLVNINDMKKTWQTINKFLTNRKRKSHTITALKDPRDNNLIRHNFTRIPNFSNEHFATIGNKLAKKLSPRKNYIVRSPLRAIATFFFMSTYMSTYITTRH